MKEPKFKGGPIFLNSGGTGPDDCLLKLVQGGRWYRVICRYGRHYQGSQIEAALDRASLEHILQAGVERVAVGDNALRWHNMHGGDKEKADALTLSATEFWERYGNYQPGAKTQICTTVSDEARALFDRLRKEDHRTVRCELEWLIAQEAQRRGWDQ